MFSARRESLSMDTDQRLMNIDAILKKYKLNVQTACEGTLPSSADPCDILFHRAWQTQYVRLITLADEINSCLKKEGEVRTDSRYGSLFRKDYDGVVHCVNSAQYPKAEEALKECLGQVMNEPAALVREYELSEIKTGLFKKNYSCEIRFVYEKFSGFRETAFKLALAFAGRRPPDDERSAEYLRICDSTDPEVAKALNANPLTDTKSTPEEMYAKGMNALQNNDNPSRALNYIRLAADKGHVPAQLKAGEMYENGTGTLADSEKALAYYRMAADSGNADARFRTGEIYARRGTSESLKEAFRYYRMAADGGNADAQYRTAMCLAEGKGTGRNREEAIKYLKLAADQGNEQALKRLSTIDPGILQAKEQQENPLEHMIRLSEQGNPTAMTKVAIALIEGSGIARDPEKGFKLLIEAAETGFREAQYRAGLCLKNGVGTEIDFDCALMFFRKAADGGHRKAYSEAENLSEAISRFNEGERLCSIVWQLYAEKRFDEIIKIIAENGDILKNKDAVRTALKDYVKQTAEGITDSNYVENIRKNCTLPDSMDASDYFYDIAVDFEKENRINCAVTAYVYAALEGSRKALSVLFAMAAENGRYFITVDEMLLA